LSVVNNGTVDLVSLQVAGMNILGEPLRVGESREIAIAPNQSCETDLTIQLASGYASLDWNGVTLCGATMTLGDSGSLTLSY
ncbi:MAG: hypothetical protein AAFO84_08455, partial [Cyanobacteria bacterium J06598_1]